MCSSEDSWESMNKERQLLIERAKDDAEVAEVLQIEADARGGDGSEPSCIPCKPMGLSRQNSS